MPIGNGPVLHGLSIFYTSLSRINKGILKFIFIRFVTGAPFKNGGKFNFIVCGSIPICPTYYN